MSKSSSDPEVSSDQSLIDELVRRTEAMVPGIRARSRQAEQIRRIPDETMAEVEAAGFLKLMVPKSFGGLGLGFDALCRISRALAHGDCSTAWAVSFLIEHNWMLCRVADLPTQKALLAKKGYIRAAAPLLPSGQAIGVDGGYSVSGHWRYASGACNGEWSFVTSWLEEGGERIPHTFLLSHDSVTVNDDWYCSGMAATGSVSITGEKAFVPSGQAIRTDLFLSRDNHSGASHPEPFFHYPLNPPLHMQGASIILGAGEAMVELGRKHLMESKLFGHYRYERPQPRARWAEAQQKVRCAQLLWRETFTWLFRKLNSHESWSNDEEGQFYLDILTIGHNCKDAVRLIMDGVGSSAFQVDNPMPRYLRDVDVIVSWPPFDWDTAIERATRWQLGLGGLPFDPFLQIAKKDGQSQAKEPYAFVRDEKRAPQTP